METSLIGLSSGSNLLSQFIPEKLVYLQQALKDGSARHAIEGLSRSGDHYNEAVECLKHRYDRPRLIHHTHVQMIVDILPLKEGTGREIHRLHDKVQQHVRALRSMGQEPDGSFICFGTQAWLHNDVRVAKTFPRLY